MTTVPRLWPGSTIACLATGPSLTQADVDFVRGKARVVAVNDAYRLCQWADVLYSSDRQWWLHYRGVPSFTGLKFGLAHDRRRQTKDDGRFVTYPDIAVLQNTGSKGLELEPTGLRNGRNSGYAAMNLAVHLGASRIVLLGYNMSHVRGRAHFFGDHPKGLSQTDVWFPQFRQKFQTLVEPLATLGVEVINCTPNTTLTMFPIRPLRDVFGEVEAAA